MAYDAASEFVDVAKKLWDSIEAAFTFDTSQSHFQPRMAMTAAMAFFSLALTMNLTGIHLSDLKPGAIRCVAKGWTEPLQTSVPSRKFVA